MMQNAVTAMMMVNIHTLLIGMRLTEVNERTDTVNCVGKGWTEDGVAKPWKHLEA